jgi:hypothetical protein
MTEISRRRAACTFTFNVLATLAATLLPAVALADCQRHVYNKSNFTLQVNGDGITWLPSGSPSPASCAGQPGMNVYTPFCVAPQSSVTTAGSIDSPSTFVSVIFGSGQAFFGTNPTTGLAGVSTGCFHFSHSGSTGNIVLNDPADLDVATCDGHCGLFAAAVTNTKDVVCIRRPRGEFANPSNSALLYKTGESACSTRGYSTSGEGFDIALGVGYSNGDNFSAWPTGYGMAPRILSIQGPQNFQQVDATTSRLAWNSNGTNYTLTVTPTQTAPLRLHFQFNGRASEGGEPVVFGDSAGLPFRVMLAMGPANNGVHDRLGGTVYVSIYPVGGLLSDPAYGRMP